MSAINMLVSSPGFREIWGARPFVWGDKTVLLPLFLEEANGKVNDIYYTQNGRAKKLQTWTIYGVRMGASVLSAKVTFQIVRPSYFNCVCPWDVGSLDEWVRWPGTVGLSLWASFCEIIVGHDGTKLFLLNFRELCGMWRGQLRFGGTEVKKPISYGVIIITWWWSFRAFQLASFWGPASDSSGTAP